MGSGMGLGSGGGGIETFWENKCESLDGWTNTATKTLDSVDPKEGDYCLKLVVTSWGVGKRATYLVDPMVSLPSLFNYSHWLKVEHMTAADVMKLKLNLWFASIGSNLYRLDDNRFTLKNNNKDTLGAAVSLNYNQWYLIKHEIEQVAGVVHNKLYIDGLFQYDTFKSWTFGDIYAVELIDSLGDFEMYFDWFRVTA